MAEEKVELFFLANGKSNIFWFKIRMYHIANVVEIVQTC